MDKAIEIKRRAQRCVQNGDLDGALSEYEKLVAIQDSDPYNFVLLADLLFKKGETGQASMRYLAAATAYESNALYKNAIAVCKKMMRLSLASLEVVGRLAKLHALDGLATESALYYVQYADLLIAQDKVEEAIESLQKAYETSPENIKALEKLGEAQQLKGRPEEAARALHQAAQEYERAGQRADAERCRRRMNQVRPGFRPDQAPASSAASAPVLSTPAPPVPAKSATEPGDLDIDQSMLPERQPPAPDRLDLDHTSLVPSSPGGSRPQGPPRLPGLGGPPTTPARVEPEADEIDLVPEASEPSANGHPDEVEDTPASPGLRFPAAPAPHEPAPGEPITLASVEHLLARAQEFFRSGQREAASQSLAEAARAYEAIGRLDSAATIFRSLGKSAHATPEVLMLWLGNCERRGDHAEAAQVACELGDRALNDGHVDQAREWFERALELDAGNDLPRRRLQRLTSAAPQGSAVATLAEPETVEEPADAPDAPLEGAPSEAAGERGAPSGAAGDALGEAGRVEVAVGRGEAVTFDLGALISEFQRGVDAQLSGDAQSHYDLAMAYREMGLLEQAVDSFRIAGQDLAYRGRCVEMIGRCLLDQGRFDDATQAFQEAFDEGSPDPEVAINLRFLLGLAHEAAGRPQEALAEFERVYAAQPSYPDVALKIRVLRKTLENL